MSQQIDIAWAHYQIHITGKGCCCPSPDLACPQCPQHADQHPNIPELVEERDRLKDWVEFFCDCAEDIAHMKQHVAKARVEAGLPPPERKAERQ